MARTTSDNWMKIKTIWVAWATSSCSNELGHWTASGRVAMTGWFVAVKTYTTVCSIHWKSLETIVQHDSSLLQLRFNHPVAQLSVQIGIQCVRTLREMLLLWPIAQETVYLEGNEWVHLGQMGCCLTIGGSHTAHHLMLFLVTLHSDQVTLHSGPIGSCTKPESDEAGCAQTTCWMAPKYTEANILQWLLELFRV